MFARKAQLVNFDFFKLVEATCNRRRFNFIGNCFREHAMSIESEHVQKIATKCREMRLPRAALASMRPDAQAACIIVTIIQLILIDRSVVLS